MSLARRSVSSVAWNMLANVIGIGVGFVRAALLARLLPVETFGVYALAGSVIGLTAVLPTWGLGGAFLHRAPETKDEDQAAAAQFTLQLVFSSAWAAVVLACALMLASGEMLLALLVLTVAGVSAQLNQTPRLGLRGDTLRLFHING